MASSDERLVVASSKLAVGRSPQGDASLVRVLPGNAPNASSGWRGRGMPGDGGSERKSTLSPVLRAVLEAIEARPDPRERRALGERMRDRNRWSYASGVAPEQSPCPHCGAEYVYQPELAFATLEHSVLCPTLSPPVGVMCVTGNHAACRFEDCRCTNCSPHVEIRDVMEGVRAFSWASPPPPPPRPSGDVNLMSELLAGLSSRAWCSIKSGGLRKSYAEELAGDDLPALRRRA